MPAAATLRASILEHALVVLAAFAFALSFGLNYGVANQSCYLPLALAWADPTLLTRDWYIADTTHYHPTFALLGSLFLRVDRGGWLFASLHLLLVTASVTALYRVLSLLLERRQALGGYFVLLAFGFVTRWRGPAMGYVFDGELQPSGMASVAFLLALPPFVSGRFFSSGVFLALSGLFHLNHLALFTAGFGVAHLVLGREALLRRLVRQFAPVVLVLAGFAPLMLRSAGSHAGADLARHIYLQVRNPHHFSLGHQWVDFLPYVAWVVLGLGAVLAARRGPEERPIARLTALAVGLSVSMGAGIALKALDPKFAVLFSWRIVPHAVIVLQLLVVATLLGHFERKGRGAFSPVAVVVFVAGAVFLLLVHVAEKSHAASELVAVLLVLSFAAGWLRRSPNRQETLARLLRVDLGRAVPWLGLALLVWFGQGPTLRFPTHSTLLASPTAEDALYAFMREKTVRTAVFLTPPDLVSPRLLGERAIVVDWRCIAAVPAEILDWYGRMLAVIGRREMPNVTDLVHYNAMDPARLELLRARYPIDYAVVRRGHERGLAGYARAYENADFVVLSLARPEK